MRILEERAQALATVSHCGQYRKDGETPYIRHPEAVVALLKDIGIRDEDTICAAWLHDIIEDCDWSKEAIEAAFNQNIANIVAQLTRDVGREEYKQRIQEADYAVKIIKLADYIHNCATLNTPGITRQIIDNKAMDYQFYSEIAEEIHPPFGDLIAKYIGPYLREHHLV